MWRRQKRKAQDINLLQQNTTPSLQMQSLDGSIQVTFSNKVVNSMRQLLGRIESRTNLEQKMGIISALREEGVTYVSQALATIMANDLAADVCIVDLNWWTSVYAGRYGISEVVQARAELDDVLVLTNYPNLVILPSGELSVEQRPILARSDALKNIFVELAERFDYLILDLPAILFANESVPLASLADMNCVVIQQGATSSSYVRLALDEVRHLNLLGVILNQVETYTPSTLLNMLPID